MYGNFYGVQPQQPPQIPAYGMPPAGNVYPGQGFIYAPRPAPRYTQPVTAELSKMLFQHNDELDIRISNAEKIRNWCTHKEPGTGRLALVNNADNDTVTCRTCGATFSLMSSERIEKMAAEGKIKTIKDIQDIAIDIIQTIKSLYVDIPEEFLKNYSQTRSMIEKFNDLYERASKNFAIYETYSGMTIPTNSTSVNPFAAMGAVLNGQWGMPMYGAPVYPGNAAYPGYPVGYPQQPAQPGAAPQPGVPAAPQPVMSPMAPPAGYVTPWGPANGGGVPMIDPATNMVYPAPAAPMPPAPTTMAGQPVAAGFNPFVAGATPVPATPGAMSAPASMPTPAAIPPAPPVGNHQQMKQQAPAVDGIAVGEPTQTKQMTV